MTAEVSENSYIHMDFNSHAHVERDVFVLPITIDSAYFNSHAHVERDTRFTALAL